MRVAAEEVVEVAAVVAEVGEEAAVVVGRPVLEWTPLAALLWPA